MVQKLITRVGIERKANVERHVIPPPIEIESCCSAARGRSADRLRFGWHGLDQSKSVLSECRARITASPSPKLDVVSRGTWNVIAPMRDFDVTITGGQPCWKCGWAVGRREWKCVFVRVKSVSSEHSSRWWRVYLANGESEVTVALRKNSVAKLTGHSSPCART